MIPRDAEPIEHRPPLPRIQIGQPDPQPSAPNTEDMRDEMWRFQRQVEGDRIWKLIEQASEGNG
jgi:hypothetical protein